MTVILVFFILHWYLSLFSQTFFLHRYAAHNMFSMRTGWEKFFYFFTWFTQGSSYLSPYVYAVLHRLHHAYTDTENDPHSPKYEKGLFSLMFKTWKIYNAIDDDKLPVDEKFKKNLPQWRKFDRFAGSNVVRILFALAYIAIYVIFAPSFWWYLLLPIHFFMGPVHGVIINYFAHKYGYRNYKLEDTSVNFLPVDFLMMGESYHNNHHKFIGRPNFGVRWFELDPTYPMIILLSKMRIIRLSTEAQV
ncbi:MAG: acyl-CoA desaturase [Chitinophagales bacterium]